jgi:hypothetical protein
VTEVKEASEVGEKGKKRGFTERKKLKRSKTTKKFSSKK